MPRALSSDLRWRIVWLYHYQGLSYKSIADLLYIHKSTVRRVINRFDLFSDVSPTTNYVHGPRRTLEQPDLYGVIVEAVMSHPGMYLSEMQKVLLKNTGISVSLTTICRTLKRLGFTRKRLRYIAMQQNEFKRQEFIDEMEYLDANMIVWLDETGSDRRNAHRRFGYHLRGLTPTDFMFTVRGQRYSTIAIMSTDGIEDFDTYSGTINGDCFGDFIDRCLTPILQPFNGSNHHSVVVMDNASIHHTNRVITSIQNTGAIVRFMPPYSPDLNPLEESFAKVKQFLKANEEIYDITSDPRIIIAMGFNSVTKHDCKQYITIHSINILNR